MAHNREKTKNPSEHFFLDPFTQTVCADFNQKIQELFQVPISLYELAQDFTPPPNKDWGHWAYPCFALSQKLKKDPAEMARQISKNFNSSPVFEKLINKGPYVNCFLKKDFLKTALLNHLQTGALFSVPTKKTGSYLIEYSQPNTHKELHIGHTRNLCFGLALVTLLQKRGFSVVTCTYPGDMGAHVAKCLWYLKYHNKEPFPTREKGQWLGKIYTKAFQKYEQDQKENNQNPLTVILQQLQKKQGEFYNLWNRTRPWSKALMDEVYKWAGAQFDHWYWESDMDQLSIKWVKELYQQGLLKISEGAVGIDLGKDLGFCLLLKSDGNGLYATKDLYLARKKFKDHKPAKNIYIVDQRQSAHFDQIFQTLKHIGFADEAKKSFHLKYNFVELKTGAMSSRAGNIVPIMTLIENMTHYIETSFLEKYKDLWSEQKIKSTANMIAQGAIKYGMNEQDLNKKIVFDMKEWLNLDGRSGPYIQYAHARACSLLKKLKAYAVKEQALDFNINKISAPEEWDLLLHLSWFSLTMERCAWRMKTAPVCHYLFELAQKFSRFYQNCPIGTLTDEEQKSFRLCLAQATRNTLKEGLNYLTIPAPEQM